MKSKFYTNKSALNIPWTESPFFYDLLKNSNDLTDEQKKMCQKYHEDGYVVIDLNLSDDVINNVVKDMYTALENEETVFHPEHVTYTPTKRIFEEWKNSRNIGELTVNETLINVIKLLPGSHKWEIYDYESLNLTHPDNIENGEAENYSYYENFLIDLIKSKNGKTKPVSLKKGQALIWAANMLHGGCNIEGVTDLEKTRLTQANHYFFYGCDEYYCPMFSEKSKGKYAKKWCDDDNNIKTHLDKIK